MHSAVVNNYIGSAAAAERMYGAAPLACAITHTKNDNTKMVIDTLIPAFFARP
jgi:hypothetical protein